MKGVTGLAQSKKAVVFLLTAALMAAVMFGGFDPAAVGDFTDKLYKLAMAYLGGQGLADLGRYAGEAYASGKKAIDTRDPARDVTMGEVAAVATSAGEKVSDAIARAEEKRAENDKLNE